MHIEAALKAIRCLVWQRSWYSRSRACWSFFAACAHNSVQALPEAFEAKMWKPQKRFL